MVIDAFLRRIRNQTGRASEWFHKAELFLDIPSHCRLRDVSFSGSRVLLQIEYGLGGKC